MDLALVPVYLEFFCCLKLRGLPKRKEHHLLGRCVWRKSEQMPKEVKNALLFGKCTGELRVTGHVMG